MIKLVLFDFDGTIANTLSLIIGLFNKTAPKYNLPTIKKTDINVLRNSSARELLKKYKISLLTMLRLKNEVMPEFKKSLSEASIFPGVVNEIKLLKDRGIKVGIVTSNTTENVELFLKKNNVSVDLVWSEKGVFGKSKIISKIVKEYKIKASDVVYVGDEVRDIEAARKSGALVMSVGWGFNSVGRLKKAKPDYLASVPREITSSLFGKTK